MEKTRLQMFTQKNGLGLPLYRCSIDGPGHIPRFKATVTCNNETFESPDIYKTKKDAEIAAAEVALKALLSRRNPEPQISLAEDGTVKCEASQHKSVEYKIRLQEAAQKAKVTSPTYVNESSGESHSRTFTCTVEVAGKSFRGESCKTKKLAENSASYVAWFALMNDGTEEHNEGTEEKIAFSHVVSTLQKNFPEKGMNSPGNPVALGNLYKNAPPNKRLRVELPEEEPS